MGELDDFQLPPRPTSRPAPAAATTSEDDLLDLDDFSLGDDGPETPAPAAPIEESAPEGLEGDVTVSGGFTLGTESLQFEPDSFAVAPPTPGPAIDLAADINLGLADEAAPPSAADAEAMSLAGLETFEAGTIAGAPDDVPALETEGFFDLPPVAELPTPEPAAEMSTVNESAPVDGGHDGAEMAEATAASQAADVAETMPEPPVAEIEAEPAEAFVTETMAELYIQQGHLDSALDIYRKLVEQRPEEPELRERLRAIEERMFGTPAVAESNATYPPPLPSYGGPTIREFLIGLVSRAPANGWRQSPEQVVDQSEEVEPPRREARMTPGAIETITGSIDALFSGASASASDTAAADALAAAFAETAPDPASPESTPLEGTPAHRAQDELSLDHVFKANTPPSQSGGTNGFSFDQFFADEMTDPAEESSAEASPRSPEATDDIAQFNAWLNGLKKT